MKYGKEARDTLRRDHINRVSGLTILDRQQLIDTQLRIRLNYIFPSSVILSQTTYDDR